MSDYSDWPTARAEFERLLGHLRTRRRTGLPGSNMMTPDVLGIVEVDGDVIEVSTGLGFRHERICHFSLSDVLAAITAERCARCAAVLDPSVFHDDDHQGRPLCEDCCDSCNEVTL